MESNGNPNQLPPISNWDELEYDFNDDIFISLIKKFPIYPIEESNQVKYLLRYLKHIQCKAIIVENRYIDRYFLDDYLHFYGNCYRDYGRVCKRLHFFSIQPREIKQYIDAILCAEDKKSYKEIKKSIQKSYLGFVVIKPIPYVIIGSTLLKTYDETNFQESSGFISEKRHILTLKNYTAHLFGIPLKISSLHFQQQDSVIAACATIALWPILDKIGDLYGYYSPTPFEITQKANETFSESRMIPSSGLSLNQIVSTLRGFGYEVESKTFEIENPEVFTNYNDFLGFCYAYLRGGIPIYLEVDIENFGNHALAVLGYKLKKEIPENNEVPLVGNRIESLYVHDDNLGPFARFDVDFDEENSYLILKCEDYQTESKTLSQMFPFAIAIPLYPKIRISYFDLLPKLKEILDAFEKMEIFGQKGSYVVEWDCFLTSSNEFKKEILLGQIDFPPEIKTQILRADLPRFLWRNILALNDFPILEIIADATDGRNALPFLAVIIYSPEVEPIFKKIAECENELRNIIQDGSLANYLIEFFKSLR